MAALQDDRYIWRRDGHVLCIPVKQGARIYKGALVCRSGGYAVPAADASGLSFAGVALESVDNTTGANGDAEVRVWQTGVFPVFKASAAMADIGQQACCVDDQTVALPSATTHDVICGRIVRVLGTGQVELKIDGAAF